MTAALLLASCGGVAINDERFYVDAGASGAVTVNFLTPGSILIEKDQWDLLREGMYCMKAESFGDIKAEIEKLCSKTRCDYATLKKLDSFVKRLEKARRH